LILSSLRAAASFDSLFHGVYESYEEAQRHIPVHRRTGYNHQEATTLYRHFMSSIRLSDYPVLFWLRQIINERSSVFDLGGHVGLAYYLFRRYLDFPDDLKWIVCDVPEICRAGLKIAQEKKQPQLSFTTELGDVDGLEILLAAGALQVIETPISSILGQLERKPLHILINRTPLSDGASFFSVQDFGTVVSPYHVFNRGEFVDSILQQGYELVDSWPIAEPLCGSFVVRFHSEKSLHSYSGLYFRLRRDQRTPSDKHYDAVQQAGMVETPS